MALSTGTESRYNPLPPHNLCQTWPLLISNTYRCTASVIAVFPPIVQLFYTHSWWVIHTRCTRFSRRSNPLLTRCCPLLLQAVPFFFPTVSEAVRSDSNIHLLHGPKRPPTICNSVSNLLKPVANTYNSKSNRIEMDANDAICLVEDLWELQSDGESVGQGSSLTQETAVQQSRKRWSDPIAARRQRRQGLR